MNRLYNLPAPIIFGHRGASAYAPENTLAAFQLAVEQHADAIELDVKLTRDGEVVVLHDQTVDRTTDGHGDLRTFDLKQLKKLDAGHGFSDQFNGEPIPTLDEVFTLVGNRIFINIELTNYASSGDGLVEIVAELVGRHNLGESIMFSSFHPGNILRARQLLPETPAALLTLPGAAGWIFRSFPGRWISPAVIHPYFSDVQPAFARRQQHLKRRVHAWTVNDPDEMKRLVALGVKGIITDDPLIALQVRGDV